MYTVELKMEDSLFNATCRDTMIIIVHALALTGAGTTNAVVKFPIPRQPSSTSTHLKISCQAAASADRQAGPQSEEITAEA